MLSASDHSGTTWAIPKLTVGKSKHRLTLPSMHNAWCVSCLLSPQGGTLFTLALSQCCTHSDYVVIRSHLHNHRRPPSLFSGSDWS